MGEKGEKSAAPSPLPGIGNPNTLIITNLPVPLTSDEKRYLLAVERGDLANVRRILQRAHRKHHININCVDSLGRGALTLSIDSESLEMVELLIIMGVETKDALLQAINAEFVEAVELLLEHEELIHKDGEPYSWQKVDINTAMFTPDITPLILAAHRNNYEILKILLDRGATIPVPHDTKCGCEPCLRQSSEDSLRHSLSRVNEYKALASPSLIALNSADPLITAFELSWELRNLAFQEQECKSEYLELRRQCQQFAVDLLDQSRSSQELAIILNHDPESPPYMDGDKMKLARLELAINYKQKKFVAHPNIQQLLAALWYEGVPGFRRLSGSQKAMTCIKVAVFFPLYCLLYMVAPNSSTSELMRKPFMKFLIHASSYLLFLFVLILVSQRAEVQVIQLFGTEAMRKELEEQLARQRGNGPTMLECIVVLYVLGYIWEETQEIWAEGIRSYLRNMWNFIDFSRNFLYCMVALLRLIAYIQQTNEISQDPSTAYISREQWDDFDPQLIAEGLFAAANIFSALKLIHLFSINPHLGPLQISLGRMVIDIVKFFCIYSLVLLAFACGLNQLLWYFADLEKQKCYVLPGGLPDWDNTGDACMKWRRFGNLFESSQSLFWASFGMVGLENFELTGIKSYTRFWGLLMFGSYSVINVIVLLNLLIAMMSNSYAMIEQHSDTEWKFARTKLWMSYFEDSATLPPPFNIFPNMKLLLKLCGKSKKRVIERHSTIRRKEEKERDNRYSGVMRSLVWRYVSAMHRREEESPVTEDDVNEVKMEISSMRYEILEIFEKNGMDIAGAEKKEKTVLARKMKVWERRLMKDFQVAGAQEGEAAEEVEEEEPPPNVTGLARFKRAAQKVATSTATGKWGQVMADVGVGSNSQIGRCRNRQSFKNQQNLQRAMEEARRLVARSPVNRSGSASPIDIPDEANDTLMQLLKNIAEEMQEISPAATLCVDKKGKKGHSRSNTPVTSQLLQDIMANKSPIPPVGKSKGNDGRRSPKPSRRASKDNICKSPPSVTSPNPGGMRSATPKPTGITSPPPIIRITEHESVEPVEMKKQESAISSPTPTPADMDNKNSLPKKRMAPKPDSAIVSRPVAAPLPHHGIIPPPPSKKDESHESITVSVIKPHPADSIITIPKCESPMPTIVNITQKDDEMTITMETPSGSGGGGGDNVSSTGSCEKLVPSASATPRASPSPVCLRPIRRIEDVTTIKRQPKTGWL